MRIHLLAKAVEGTAVLVATAGAASGLKHAELGIPLDRWGMWADLVAGTIFAGHVLYHRWHKRKENHE